MELVMALAIGILFTIGVYLILSKTLLRIVLGTSLLTHGVHLLLLTMAGLKKGAAPVLGKEDTYVDPLPQALILTSIVISFGVTAFYFVLAYRSYQSLGTDDIDSIKEVKE
ncbi:MULTISPECIES: Na(+)/H(+) antiporter subunit C [unclassified Paenibacillus]|uniref:Na(+)/H(+) antiporter subunit C n=1 Tax=unclassified Paenibacillus TaxID=185978 RepID=UPI002406AF2B|nr:MULTISPECIES: Na(+)/H(+) antiporter subunit C [unclassified Paenibacillus]MDF9839444.1 multicomponent Na+:H+ antiporter subunit C [Paenibacillus sp. PastF-2]MDF9846024.1 multicomponent Na+:H+ antiporter subunit C [Paenibacillus sp. PastM-2]MDF9852597.1 multicomponent Na+:H+ antiporter subunit C [Paenibacillus sp. PastF-1]MDH6477672.1 multicomponent Na+:H+ antiporter subunit C [Paenibacillus sp. PastH-2]MDH6505412.1 multicomponent Na+:H+ antiporter subunit C [Paenibacillus sp. PastM-3]